MRLVTFSTSDDDRRRERFGAQLENHIVDLTFAYQAMRASGKLNLNADNAFPSSTLEFLARGEAAHAQVARVLDFIQSNQHDFMQNRDAMFDEANVNFLPPITRPSKIICIGQNYMEHIREMNRTPPKYPLFFAKYANTLTGHRQAIRLPRVSKMVDYEAELVMVIGRRGKFIEKREAMNYVAGFMNFNDVSVRDYQERTSQFLQGKTFDTCGPCGAALVTKDEVPDPHNLSVALRLNNETMQHGSTSDFIFDLPTIINYLSEIMTLEPGDMIATGTPSGVGAGRTPQVFLKAGDTVEVEIEGLGVLTNSVVNDERKDR